MRASPWKQCNQSKSSVGSVTATRNISQRIVLHLEASGPPAPTWRFATCPFGFRTIQIMRTTIPRLPEHGRVLVSKLKLARRSCQPTNDLWPGCQALAFSDAGLECNAECSVIVANEIFRRTVPWERFGDLARQPLRRRIAGHRKPQQAPPFVPENQKCEQLLKGNRRNNKQINRSNPVHIIAKEDLPRLQWPILPRHHVDRNCGLGDLDAELEQLAMELTPRWTDPFLAKNIRHSSYLAKPLNRNQN